MIQKAWVWYERDAVANLFFVEVLMELENGELCGLTYGGNLVFNKERYLDGRVTYDLDEMLVHCNAGWERIL